MTGSHGSATVGGKKVAILGWEIRPVKESVYQHPDYLAFVRAMRESPDDDTPRLAVADWLQERNEEVRAEFIRAQIGLEKYRGQPSGGIREYDELSRRERDLWRDIHELLPRELGAYITLGTPDDFGNAVAAAQVRRGFVEVMRVTAADWLQYGDAILEQHPVRAVKLTTAMETGPRVWKTEWRKGEHISAQWLREWPGITFDWTWPSPS